jgi:cell division cycle 2-like protein
MDGTKRSKWDEEEAGSSPEARASSPKEKRKKKQHRKEEPPVASGHEHVVTVVTYDEPVAVALPPPESMPPDHDVSPPHEHVEMPLMPLQPSPAPPITSCRSVHRFEKLNRIAEGTYGVVYRARDLSTGDIVALKRLKLEQEEQGFPITSLREIYTLLLSQHQHIVNVREIVMGDDTARCVRLYTRDNGRVASLW